MKKGLTIRQLLQKNAVISLLGNGLNAILGLLTLMILVRLTNAETFGQWILFLTLYTLFDTLRTGLVLNGLIFHTAHTNEETTFRRWAGAAWQISIVLTIAASLLIGGGAWLFQENGWGNDWFMQVVWIWVLTAFVSMPAIHSVWFWHSRSQFKPMQTVRPAIQLLFLLFIGVNELADNPLTVEGLCKAYGTSYALVSLATIVLGPNYLHSVGAATAQERKPLVDFGKYCSGTLLVSNLLRSSNTLLIGAFLNPAAVVIYAIPQRLLELVEMPVRSIVVTDIPQLVAFRQRQQPGLLAHYFHTQAGQVWVAMLPVSLVGFLLAEPLVVLLGGTELDESATILRWFMIYTAFLPLERYSGVGLDAVGQPNRNFLKVSVMLILTLLGTTIAVLWQSLVAVAVVNTVIFLIGLLLGFYLIRPYAPISLAAAMRAGWQQGGTFIKQIRHELVR
ncbi:hypothetical protein GCM10027347_56470 [Larkinella harenae]